MLNVIDPIPSPSTVSLITHLYDGYATQAIEIQNFYYRVRSYMTSKAIEGSIKKIS